MKKSTIKSLFLRYILLLAIGLAFATPIFYNILLPLTIYPVYFILKLFYDALIYSPYIFVETIAIEIIPACVAASAYFLLIILNLVTPMSKKQRRYSLLFSILSLLIINILRILLLSVLLIKEAIYFDIVHKVLWFGVSIILVVVIWFLTVYLFKIKDIPAYSDIKLLLKKRTK